MPLVRPSARQSPNEGRSPFSTQRLRQGVALPHIRRHSRKKTRLTSGGVAAGNFYRSRLTLADVEWLVEILFQPAVYFLVPVAAVFAFQNPVVLVRPDYQPTRNAQTLQHTPVFERLIERDAKVVLTNRKQYRRAKLRSETNRILLAPHCSLFPHWTTVVYFTRIDRVAGAPL